jgi:hypothetical protein
MGKVVQEDSATLGWPNETTIAINGAIIARFASSRHWMRRGTEMFG